VEGVSHAYGDFQALRDVSLRAECGVTVLLGPNGVGKSTLFQAISGGIRRQAGVVRFRPEDPAGRATAVRLGFALLPQEPPLFPAFTCREFVGYCAWTRGARARDAGELADDALALVRLSERANSKVRSLSGGMRRRLAIAATISVPSHVLLLDEPMAGLDPAQRVEVGMPGSPAGVTQT
jgi:ABC-2 type transport system ATP-binding protein